MQGTWSEEVWPDHGLLMLLLKEHILSLQPVPRVVAKPGSPPGLTPSLPLLTPPLSHPWTWLSLSCLSFPAEVLVVNQGSQRTQREETTREATVQGLRLLSAIESKKNLSKTQVLGSTLETQIQEIFQAEVLKV